MKKISFCLFFLAFLIFSGCEESAINKLPDLNGKQVGVPFGVIADNIIQETLPGISVKYFDHFEDAISALDVGRINGVVFDEPLLYNYIARHPQYKMLQGKIKEDQYSLAMRTNDQMLKNKIDVILKSFEKDGTYDAMIERWFPKEGDPGPMPELLLMGNAGVIKVGTSAVAEPFTYILADNKFQGFDIELMYRIAQRMNMRIKIVHMDFESLIPALQSHKIDIVASCMTITEERQKAVLFSEPYYHGGIGVMVKK